MSVESDVQSGAHAAAEPAAPAAPAGNPAILGLATFLPAGIILGLWLVGYLGLGLFGGLVEVFWFSSGLFLMLAALWAARLGASTVAGIFGTFSAFWLSLGTLLFFLNNGSVNNLGTALTTPDVVNILATYLLAWLIMFVLLTLGTLRLPLIFTAGFVFVCIAVAFVLAFVLSNLATTIFAQIAGICVFIFCAIFAYIMVDGIQTELGGKAMPMGSAILR